MNLIDRENKTYAPPAKLVASEQEVDIRASYGPSPWVQQHRCTVRGVRVDKLAMREGENHVWCLFPDGRVMLVAEKNIYATKISVNNLGAIIHEHPTAQ